MLIVFSFRISCRRKKNQKTEIKSTEIKWRSINIHCRFKWEEPAICNQYSECNFFCFRIFYDLISLSKHQTESLVLFQFYTPTTIGKKKLNNGNQFSPVVFYGSPQGVPPKRPARLLRLLHEIRVELAAQHKLRSFKFFFHDILWAFYSLLAYV